MDVGSIRFPLAMGSDWQATARRLFEIAHGSGLVCRVETPQGDTSKVVRVFVAQDGSASALAAFGAAVRQAHPQMAFSASSEPKLRPLVGIRGRDLVVDDYRREIDAVISTLHHGDTSPSGASDSESRRAWYAHRKANSFMGDVQSLLNAFFEPELSLNSALALSGRVEVTLGRRDGPGLANDNLAHDGMDDRRQVGDRQARRAVRIMDLFLDGLAPVLAAHDASPSMSGPINEAADRMLDTTSRIERMRFLARVMPGLVPTPRERALGRAAGDAARPERQWVFETKCLVAEGLLDEALRRLDAVPNTSAARGRSDSWFAATHERMSAAIRHLQTGEPTWNESWGLWCTVVELRGIGGGEDHALRQSALDQALPIVTPPLWRAHANVPEAGWAPGPR